MTGEPLARFEYDVALSFAAEDRAAAEELASLLRAKNRRVLYDEYQAAAPGGSDFVTHLAELYRTKARCCVLFISQHYPLEQWTEAERTAAREHALRDANEYFFLVRLDEAEVPGAAEAAGYRDLRRHSIERIAGEIEQKLAQATERSGPPPQSHDLRSGNIPPKPREDA